AQRTGCGGLVMTARNPTDRLGAHAGDGGKDRGMDEFNEPMPEPGSAEWEEWDTRRLAHAASRFTDDQIFDRWCTAGERLWPGHREHFVAAFEGVMSAFEGAPESAKVPTLENWCDAGGRLLTAGYRELIFVVATKAMLML